MEVQICYIGKIGHCLQCNIVCFLMPEDEEMVTLTRDARVVSSTPVHLLQEQDQVAPGKDATQAGCFAEPLLSLQSLPSFKIQVAKVVLAVRVWRT